MKYLIPYFIKAVFAYVDRVIFEELSEIHQDSLIRENYRVMLM